jgi:hypothetical protein
MKKNLIKTTIIAVLALVVILVGASNALADDFICNGIVWGGTFDNVIVVAGDAMYDCEMIDAIITGNVWIEEDAWAWFRYITVGGNFQTDGGERVLLYRSTVYGDVQIKNAHSAGVYESYIGGNLVFEENTIGDLWFTMGLSIHKNVVEGNLQVNKNTLESIYIVDHIIGGNLQCDDNDPPPHNWGAPNIVGGNKEGQCSDL